MRQQRQTCVELHQTFTYVNFDIMPVSYMVLLSAKKEVLIVILLYHYQQQGTIISCPSSPATTAQFMTSAAHHLLRPTHGFLASLLSTDSINLLDWMHHRRQR